MEVKANSMTNKRTLKFAGSKGVQKPSRFEGGPEEVLRMKVGAVTSEAAVLTLTTIMASEEKVEVNSVV